jgi:hypothetical protein
MVIFYKRLAVKWLSVVLFLAFAGGLIVSLFLKERWLWMDEVCSYVLLSDASLAHAQQAVVGGIDANPPLFIDVYWLLGHGISLAPQFLRSVSIVLFALAVVLFFRDTTRLLGRPVLNFVVVTLFVSLTYLNYSLATQVRSYALLLLLFWLYFANSHRLASAPAQPRRLWGQLLLGTVLAYTHNFGLLYAVVLTGFFIGLLLWSGRSAYWRVLAVQVAVGGLWLLGWFRNFEVQAQAGKPHSWIPLPTLASGFRTVGELLPTVSAGLEASRYGLVLPIVRVCAMLALLAALSWPWLRRGHAALVREPAALLLVQATFVALGSLGAALVASWVVTSVFLARYLWPVELLFAVGALVAAHRWVPARLPVPARGWVLVAYMLALPCFMVHQNRKTVHFPSAILAYLSALDHRYPVFYESADYFLPIWYQQLHPGARFLLDWPAALRATVLSATVDYHILSSLRASYGVAQVVPLAQFKAANYPHFYVVDEQNHYQIEEFINSGRVQVLRVLPTAIADHQILECRFR